MEETAYHESGHAFMAHRLGAIVDSVTIDPDRDDGLERHGDTRVLWPRPLTGNAHFQRHLVAVALAGPVAEMIYRGEPLHPGMVAEWADDWCHAWEAAAALHANERTRLAFLEQTSQALHELLSAEQNWAAIAALADNLLAHETLDRESVQEIFAAWLD